MTPQALWGLPLSWATATAVPRMLFQSVVDLRTGDVVGYEAFARGPAGTAWERPQDLLAQARAEGRLREVDWACRVSAVQDVQECAPAGAPWRLFLNAAAEVLGSTCPDELVDDWSGATDHVGVVVGVTEHALVHGAGRLLDAVAELREMGCEIALDDVGANDTSVALLPLVEPDVVKLDGTMLRPPYRRAGRASLHAVERYVERTGALLVAEGIETDRDCATALALGATWGQGFLFDRPAPLQDHAVVASGPPRPRVPRALPSDDRATTGATSRSAPRLVVSRTWVSDRLRAVVDWAAPEASRHVVLLHLPDPSLAPSGLFDALDRVHESSPLTAVVLGTGGGRRQSSPRAVAAGPEQQATTAVFLGPADAHVMVARPLDDGRFEVSVSDSTADVAAAARHFVRTEL